MYDLPTIRPRDLPRPSKVLSPRSVPYACAGLLLPTGSSRTRCDTRLNQVFFCPKCHVSPGCVSVISRDRAPIVGANGNSTLLGARGCTWDIEGGRGDLGRGLNRNRHRGGLKAMTDRSAEADQGPCPAAEDAICFQFGSVIYASLIALAIGNPAVGVVRMIGPQAPKLPLRRI